MPSKVFASTVQLATTAVILGSLLNPARLERTVCLAPTLSAQSAQQAILVRLLTLYLNFVPLVAILLWHPLSVISVQLDLHAHRMSAFQSHVCPANSVKKEVR